MSKSEDDWHAQETYRSMIEFGQGMLRFTFLANGAAVISIMTFLGHRQRGRTSDYKIHRRKRVPVHQNL
jgi:hypothetical protein